MKWLKDLFRQSTAQPASDRSEKYDDDEVERASRVEAFTSLLSPDDFANVGVTGTSGPRAHMDDPNSVYMVYRGASGATGGVELDVFVSEGEAEEVFDTVNAETRGEADVDMNELVGVQAVTFSASTVDGTGKFAGLNVRRGELVFCLSIPDSPDSAKQLYKLASLVLDRFENLKL